MAGKSASGGTSGTLQIAPMVKNVRTCAPSVEALTMPSPGLAAPNLSTSDDFLSAFIDSQKFLVYTNFADSIIRRPFLSHLHSFPSLFEKITTPYDVLGFDFFLNKHNLVALYPLLCSNLVNGFPIGHMPALTQTTIIPNHLSCREHLDQIQSYLEDEVNDGRMSGPFSKFAIESILRGPFFSSPLLVALQSQAPGIPDKICICRHLSKDSHSSSSVNSHVTKESFPTRFDTASRVADIVCLSLSTILYSIPIMLFHSYHAIPIRESVLFAILHTILSISDI
jgi:hypothetical protein